MSSNEPVRLEKEKGSEEGTLMKPLRIVWQRLVSAEGQTCDRCGATNNELQRATVKLKDLLSPLGVEPTLETKEIDERAFKANPSASNRIWIGDRPLEEWLTGTVGSSRCCSVCGESECRTIEVGGAVFEAIPEELILKAALVAAAQMLSPTNEALSSQAAHDSGNPPCCEGRLSV